MTLLIGILCQDGVVIGSDSSATFAAGQFRTIEQPAKKTFVISPDVIVAGTGAVGLGQRFAEIVRGVRVNPQNNFLAADPFVLAKGICANAINDFASTQAPKGTFGALAAFCSGQGFHLVEFGAQDLQPEFKTDDCWFVSMGSGQPIADPFLGMMRRVFFKGSKPALKEGIFLTFWALTHAIDLNTGGINGPAQIGILSKDARGLLVARLLTDDEIQEHDGSVRAAESHLAIYRDIISGKKASAQGDIPPLPPVPPAP